MNRRRRAVSLVELLVVMSATTVVVTLASTLLCRVMRIQIESRAHVDAERNSLRLSEQFRRDAHQARAAVTNRAELSDDIFLRLQFTEGRQADYSLHDGVVVRKVSDKGGQASRDEYKFPAACELSIQQEDTPPRLALTLTVKPSETLPRSDKQHGAARAYPVSLQVEAIVGRDLRFTTARQETSR